MSDEEFDIDSAISEELAAMRSIDHGDFRYAQTNGQFQLFDESITFELDFPWGKSSITGGPYNDKPEGTPGIKLAAEIRDESFTLNLPIRDFSQPDPEKAEQVLAATIALLRAGVEPYAGCGWGKGRTGLFLALLVKVADASVAPWYRSPADPVKRIRELYRSEACETSKQIAFVREFNISRLVKLTKQLSQ